MSISISTNSGDTPGALDYPLEADIVDDHTMSARRVHPGCILKLFPERYLIDLVPIPMRGTKIIVSMD